MSGDRGRTDVDGDAIPFRTYPGTHPTKGGYFTRGTSHDARARYSEEGVDYVEGMQRLLRKHETAKGILPRPLRRDAEKPTRFGVIYYGSTAPAMSEALAALSREGINLDTCRVRAFPFAEAIVDFALEHDQVFVVEQNRDAQLKTLLVNECAIDPARLTSILQFDGTPVTARFIRDEIAAHVGAHRTVPLKRTA